MSTGIRSTFNDFIATKLLKTPFPMQVMKCAGPAVLSNHPGNGSLWLELTKENKKIIS